MAIEVDIPMEIENYKEKIIFGMSLRQLVCFSSAVVAGVGAYFVCTKALHMSMDAASYVIIFLAMPLMALGFIKKDGQPFEKYLALMLRQRIGNNKLSYSTETELQQESNTERKSKYAWIFEKESTGDGNPVLPQRERKQEAGRKEAVIFTADKESQKRNRKATRQKVKAAQKEYRTAKQRYKKESKERSRTEKCG